MLYTINSLTPYVGLIICFIALIWTRFRTLELDSTMLFYIKILMFLVLINADLLDNDFVPVPSTVFARVLLVVMTFLVISHVRRFKLLHDRYVAKRAINDALRQRIAELENQINTAP